MPVIGRLRNENLKLKTNLGISLRLFLNKTTKKIINNNNIFKSEEIIQKQRRKRKGIVLKHKCLYVFEVVL
jgi:hypothetical protein